LITLLVEGQLKPKWSIRLLYFIEHIICIYCKYECFKVTNTHFCLYAGHSANLFISQYKLKLSKGTVDLNLIYVLLA